MVEEADDAAEAVMAKSARLAITIASLGVQAMTTRRQQQADELAAAESAEAARLQSRWDAERAAAHARVAAADTAWLDRVSPQEAAEV